MAKFNEKMKCGIGYSLNSREFFIYRTGTNDEFARMIHLGERMVSVFKIPAGEFDRIFAQGFMEK